MSTDNATQQRLMEARARALATVLLTRREGTLLRDFAGASDGSGIDLCATLASANKTGVRQFGVELAWQFEPVSAEHVNEQLREHGRWRKLTGSGPFPFPVVVFLFTMRDDGAWYAWAAEPVIEEGRARLPLRTEPDVHPLTDDSLEAVFDQVDAWYDAHFAGLAATGAKRSSKRS